MKITGIAKYIGGKEKKIYKEKKNVQTRRYCWENDLYDSNIIIDCIMDKKK